MGRHTREIALSEYLSFVKSRSYVVVAGERIDLWPISVKSVATALSTRLNLQGWELGERIT